MDRPILFSAPMVRALLAGTKTQTRRIVKPQPEVCGADWLAKRRDGPAQFLYYWPRGDGYAVNDRFVAESCPYGQPGDRLWVRESIHRGDACARYSADGSVVNLADWRWKRDNLPSIHCPRELSRITLEITGVRVERLQGISEADAKAEGAQFHAATKASVAGRSIPSDEWFFDINNHGERIHAGRTAKDAYELLWESINGPGSWDANPWVWVVEFKRATP
jgi:hypothetical protein